MTSSSLLDQLLSVPLHHFKEQNCKNKAFKSQQSLEMIFLLLLVIQACAKQGHFLWEEQHMSIRCKESRKHEACNKNKYCLMVLAYPNSANGNTYYLPARCWKVHPNVICWGGLNFIYTQIQKHKILLTKDMWRT